MSPIVVYTAAYGGYDVPSLVGHAGPHVCFTDDSTIPVPAPWEARLVVTTERTPRRASRYAKMHDHLLFPNTEWRIYHDANMRLRITPEALVDLCRSIDPAAKVFVCRHPQRGDCYEEGMAVKRYKFDDPRVVDSHLARYHKAGFPAGWGLYNGGMIVRCGDTQAFNERWWAEYTLGSCRDQISLPFVLWKTETRFGVLPELLGTYVENPPHLKRRVAG